MPRKANPPLTPTPPPPTSPNWTLITITAIVAMVVVVALVIHSQIAISYEKGRFEGKASKDQTEVQK